MNEQKNMRNSDRKSAGVTLFLMKLLVLSFVLVPTVFAEIKIEDWSHVSRIKMDPTPGNSWVQVPLTPEIFNLARADLGDLRVLSETDTETPYLLRFSGHEDQVQPLAVVLCNRATDDGEKTSIVLDFGKKKVKNRLEIVTAGMNFRRNVLIESGSDGQKWQPVRQDAFIFRINQEAGMTFDKDIVTFPDNDDRYVRVTVFRDKYDISRLEIDDVLAWHVINGTDQTVSVPIVETSSQDIPQEKSTEITIDLGLQNLPLHAITLFFNDSNFFRRVSISGRNVKERTIKVPVDNNLTREETVEEPWDVVTTGAVYRYSGKKGVDESLAVDLKKCQYRYLNIRVENGDESPLQFKKAEVVRQKVYLEFKPGEGKEFRLLAGNLFALAPSYELAQTADQIESQSVSPAVLEEVVSNSDFQKPGQPGDSWSKRHRGLIWTLFVAVAVFLFIRRHFKPVRRDS